MVNRERAREMTVNLYGRVRTVLTYDQVVMQKTPRRRHSVKGPRPFRLFRCQKVNGPSSIERGFCITLPDSAQFGDKYSCNRPNAVGCVRLI